MIYQHQFEIRQIELFGRDNAEIKEYKEQLNQYAKKQLFNYACEQFEVEFEEHLHPIRYRAAIFLCTEDEWIKFRNAIADLLLDELRPTVYNQVGELFAQMATSKKKKDGNPQT